MQIFHSEACVVVWLVLPGTQSSLVVMLVITHTLNSVDMSLHKSIIIINQLVQDSFYHQSQEIEICHVYRLCVLFGGFALYNEVCMLKLTQIVGWIYIEFDSTLF